MEKSWNDNLYNVLNFFPVSIWSGISFQRFMGNKIWKLFDNGTSMFDNYLNFLLFIFKVKEEKNWNRFFYNEIYFILYGPIFIYYFVFTKNNLRKKKETLQRNFYKIKLTNFGK